MDLLWLSLLAGHGGSDPELEALRARIRHRARAREKRRSRPKKTDRLDELEDEVGELRLFSRALLALLQETGALDPRRLREKVLELDASDGTADGSYDPQPEPDEKAAPPAPVSRKGKLR